MNELAGEAENDLFLTIALLNDSTEVRAFLTDILTVEEIQNIAKRWCVARLLLDGVNQDEVRVQCRASKNMVTRVNRTVIKFGTGMSSTFYKRLKKANQRE